MAEAIALASDRIKVFVAWSAAFRCIEIWCVWLWICESPALLRGAHALQNWESVVLTERGRVRAKTKEIMKLRFIFAYALVYDVSSVSDLDVCIC